MIPPSDGGRGGARSSGRDRLGAGSGPTHPFLRSLDSGLPVVGCWTESGPSPLVGDARWDRDGDGDPAVPAVLKLEGDSGGSVLTAVGEPVRLANVLRHVAETLETAPRGVVVTRGTGEHAAATLASWGLAKTSEWDRMATTVMPDVPATVLVERLELDHDHDAIAELLAVASPATQHGVDAPGHDWYGVRAPDGTLSAVGASVLRDGPDGEFAHLGGIATRPELRGQGLATAVTAHLTAGGVAAHGMVTLGMYADNTVARRVYERLGFRVIHEVETWRPAG
ncbi:GNAT family N-acetyltransferase [Myceligenerans indicum]|uniref:GNAT family N-acetyltransferase n=1 Tax=Myceligenerans indicum TaxID=2593663 RepID=A0ABS1LHV4_9MICO|nr:GNAT family N-acetyltransferase [Myceligenerans indicum]MBL0885772.1 GNAT family N-acetyltransferase [Myceligenerans indicum]